MKKILSLMSAFLFMFGCVAVPGTQEKAATKVEVSAVWVYFSELSMKSEKGGTKKSFTDKIDKIFSDCVTLGINTVFVQVRPCCDAFYKSEIFPWSAYLTGEQGKAVDYDPLEIMVVQGHKKGLTIHAWINPFRISFDDDKTKISEDNPALKWLDNKDETLAANVVRVNNGLYFSPASTDAQKIVIDGVREIVRNYDVDGIHIDDYFYPSVQDSVDESFYTAYKESGGELSLKEWRLANVSSLVSSMYSAVKSENSECIFSISPAGNINNNYSQQYADVKLWCAERGYADWIIPQIYYGFENERLSFDTACDEWNGLNTVGAVKMIYGIGAYRINESDEEWNAGNGIIKKEIEYAKSKSDYYGAAFFSYSSLIDESRSIEFDNLSELVLS